MHRFIALPLALTVSACATGPIGGQLASPSSGPRLVSPDLHVGGLDERTRFELDDSASPPATKRDASKDRVDTPKKQRRRKVLYFLGLGSAGFGVLGVTGFGIGGRIVQGQLQNGYDDGTLTRDREDQLNTTGDVMNGVAIGSAVIGLAGVILSATMYGIDHARCGELPPRRKDGCGDADAIDGTQTPLDEPEPAAPKASAPADPGPAEPAEPKTSAPAAPGPTEPAAASPRPEAATAAAE